MHIGVLHLAPVAPWVFDGDGLPSGGICILVDGHHLAVVLSRQYRISLAADVDTLVHLLFAGIHRVGAHTEWRGDKHKFRTLHRE